MKNGLLLGRCAFMGSHLRDRLLGREDLGSLAVAGNLWTGPLGNMAQIEHSRMRPVDGDIETSETDTWFDEVIHFGSPASPRWYIQEPDDTTAADVHIALDILNLIKKDGLFCFVFISEPYGGRPVSPRSESYRGSNACTGPRSTCNKSRCTTGLGFQVIRLFDVFGDGLHIRSWGHADAIIDALEQYLGLDGAMSGPAQHRQRSRDVGTGDCLVHRQRGPRRRHSRLRRSRTNREVPKMHPIYPATQQCSAGSGMGWGWPRRAIASRTSDGR